MSLILIGELILTPFAILRCAYLLARDSEVQPVPWRNKANKAALGISVIAGLYACAYIVRVAVWHDATTNAVSIWGSRALTSWGPWGIALAFLGLIVSIAAKGRSQVAASIGSVLFAAFWLTGFMILELQ